MMNIEEYMNRLAAALDGCSPDEIDNAVEYYTELIEESEDPVAQMASLGTPEELAEHIRRESGWITPSEGIPAGGQTPPPQGFAGQQVYSGPAPGPKRDNAGRVLALLLTFPFWLAAFIILGCVFVVIWSVYVSFPAAALGNIIVGFMELKNYAAYGALLITTAILFLGFSNLLGSVAVNLTRLTARGTAIFTRFLFGGKSDGKRFEWKKMGKFSAIFGGAALVIGIIGTGLVYAVARPTADKYAEHLNYESKEYDLSSGIDALSADIDIGSVKVLKASDGRAVLKAENVKLDELNISEGAGRTEISYKAKNTKIQYDPFGIQSKAVTNAKFTIYLPAEEYDELNITADLGEITVKDINTGKMSVDASCGAVDMEAVKADSIEIEANLGAVKLSNVTADTAVLTADCGAVKLDSCNIADKLSGEISLGEGTFKDMTVGTIEVQFDCGDFTYDGEILDGGNIELDLGTCTMKLSGQDYNVHGDTDTGTVKIDDPLKSGSRAINIHNDCGDIKVNAA